MRFRSSLLTRGRTAAAAVACAALAAMGLVAAGAGAGSAEAATAGTAAVPASATTGGIKVAYFDQWSIYQNAFYVKNLDTEGIAGNLNYLIYDFENISDTAPYNCFEAEKATDPDPAGENDPNAGDGAEDMDADYGKPFPANEAVSGVADTSTQTLAGNFNQLKELKAKYPNLKILLSIGGWTYSKYFSPMSSTAASRQAFVTSCINMFMDGNLPTDCDYGSCYGGTGSAAGIFDGFDIDWEYPASSGGHLGNITSPGDTADYTALLGQFRSQLNTLSSSTGKTYYLSAALPSGQDKVSLIQTSQIAQYLTFGDVMTYDMYGAWNATGPTDEQNPLFENPNSPEPKIPGGNETYSIDSAMKAWTAGDSQYGITGGFPASKLTVGVPFYYRGWSGVSAGSNHGLYQTATGASAGMTDSGDVPGVAMYKEIQSTVTNSADTFWDPVSDAAYFYDGSNFYGGEDAQSIQTEANYVHCNGYGGFMMFSLYDLDPSATLFNDAVGDINGSASSCPTAPPTSSSSASASSPGSPSASASGSSSPSTSASPTSPSSSASSSPTSTGGTPPAGNLLVNPGFEDGNLTGWTCSSIDSVVGSPVHSGSHALQGAASSSDNAQCTQTVTVSPNTTYTLSGYVDGSYVFIGDTGGGDNWTPGTSGYQPLSLNITTGAGQTSLTVYVHGWYGEGTYYADDFSLVSG